MSNGRDEPLSMWQRVRLLLSGIWMPPTGPETAEDWELANDAARFGWEARVRYRASVDPEQELAVWDEDRERALAEEWRETGHTTPWMDVREHVWRGWTAAGTGQPEERITH